MKKFISILLTAIFVSSVAHATNVLEGNPLYRPAAHRFVSETSVTTGFNGAYTPAWNSEMFQSYGIVEDFAYGVTDNFAIGVEAFGTYDTNNPRQTTSQNAIVKNNHQLHFDSATIFGSYRVMNMCAFKADVLASVGRNFTTSNGLHTYATNWSAGLKAGLDTKYISVAGTAKIHNVDFDYKNIHLAHINNPVTVSEDMWYMETGVEGMIRMSKHLEGIVGVHYDFDISKKRPYYKTDGYMSQQNPFYVEAGANVNLDSYKYVGVYGTYNVNKPYGNQTSSGIKNYGWGMKVKFGIDF